MRALNFADADHDKVTGPLITAHKSATNDEQRRRVLKLWQTFSPATESVRKRLAEDIWLPLAESGATGLRAALDYIGLVSPAPRGLRDELTDRLLAIEVQNDELAKMRDRKMRDAGWLKKPGLFGRGRKKNK